MIAQHKYGRHITAVAVAVRMSFAIFLPEQLQRQVFMSLKLGMELGEIQTRPRLRRRAQWPRRKQQLIELPVIDIVRQVANSVRRPRPFPDIDERSPDRSSNCGRSGPVQPSPNRQT